jgi:hypothetical protein
MWWDFAPLRTKLVRKNELPPAQRPVLLCSASASICRTANFASSASSCHSGGRVRWKRSQRKGPVHPLLGIGALRGGTASLNLARAVKRTRRVADGRP